MLSRKAIREHRKMLGLNVIGVIAGYAILAIVVGYICYDDFHASEGIATDWVVGVYAGFAASLGLLLAAVTGTLFSHRLSSKAEITWELTTPASQFEKFLVRWIAVVPLSWMVVLLGFEIGDLLRVNISSVIYPRLKGFSYFSLSDSGVFLPLMLALQAFYMLFSLVLPKYRFIGTTMLGMALMVAYMLVAFLSYQTFPLAAGSASFLSDFFTEVTMSVACVVAAVVMWVISYFRYKEMDIIHRW